MVMTDIVIGVFIIIAVTACIMKSIIDKLWD